MRETSIRRVSVLIINLDLDILKYSNKTWICIHKCPDKSQKIDNQSNITRNETCIT